MRIGYPAMNTRVGCTTAGTLRLSNYSEEKLFAKIESNLDCLKKILKFNSESYIEVYRMSSNLIPFASHEIMRSDWQGKFKADFDEISALVQQGNMRISLHPGQFVLINSPKPEVVENSIRELEYQVKILDLINSDETAKVQIHVGGVYDDKESSIKRFVHEYGQLPDVIKRRLVIENDERQYSAKDCLNIYSKTKVPIIFDVFHHSIFEDNLAEKDAMKEIKRTWGQKDGRQQIDFSNQAENKQLGAHSQSIDKQSFAAFMQRNDLSLDTDIDVMLEVKDKQDSVFNIRNYIRALD